MTVQIVDFSEKYAESVIELVKGILQDEFGFSEAASRQPDLLNIAEHYGSGKSNFWLALHVDELVGTIGFVVLGGGQGLLRKMFVRRSFRGGVTAELLLDHLLSWARSHDFEEIFLGTNSKFHAAHRFYLKHGFEPMRTGDLPDKVPRIDLRDTFFRRPLS